MEHTENQQIPYNSNEQGLPFNPQRSYDPPRQGDGVVPPATPAVGGENVNPQHNQYRAPLAPFPNVGRTLIEFLRPQRTKTNSCIRLLEYQGFDSENPYSYMRDFEDVCSAFLSTGSPLHIICLVLFPFSLKEKAKIWFHSLIPNSISNWEDMQSIFLNKFFPPRRINSLMQAIQNFSKKPGESFATIWKRYKELLHAIFIKDSLFIASIISK